jgi:hypothetical protein
MRESGTSSEVQPVCARIMSPSAQQGKKYPNDSLAETPLTL